MNIAYLIYIILFLLASTVTDKQPEVTSNIPNRGIRIDTSIIATISESAIITFPFHTKQNFRWKCTKHIVVNPTKDSLIIKAVDTGYGWVIAWEHADTFISIRLQVLSSQVVDSFKKISLSNDLFLIRNLNNKGIYWYEHMLINKPVPDFRIQNIRGDSLSTKSMKDNISIISFWFYGCTACELQRPDINEIAATYPDVKVYSFCKDSGYVRKNTTFYEATYYKNGQQKSSFVEHKINTNQYINAEFIASSFQVTGYPKTFVIDKKGIIRYIHSGYHPRNKEYLINEIEMLLKESL